MPYNPGVQNMSGQILGQGIAQFGKDIAGGIQQYQQNKHMAGQAISQFEGAAQANPDMLKYLGSETANPEIKSAFNKLQKGGAVGFKDAAALATFANSFVSNKEAAFQQKQRQDAATQKLSDDVALNDLFNAFQGGKNTTDALRAYTQRGGSIMGLRNAGLDVDKLLFPAANKPGQIMTMAELNDLKGKGFDAKASPMGDGRFMVSEVSPFAPSASTNINMGENSYNKEIGTLAAQQHMKEYGAAMDAPANIQKLDEVKNLLNNGDMATGMGAEIINNVNRFRSNFLADKKAGKSVSDTQVMDALLGSDVFPQIQALGIGARGLDTPDERNYLRQVMTGTITLDKDALLRLTEIRRNIQTRALKKFKKSDEAGTYKKFFEVTGNPAPDYSILDAETAPVSPQAPTLPSGWSYVPRND